MSDEPLTVVSTFAGTGGSSLGYKQAGYKMRLAVEWDDHAVECYKLNFPETKVFHGDISRLTDAEALEISGLHVGELDVFDGSPPCQGFSTAGKRSMSDDRNQLFRQYVRLLNAFRPRAFVMENVSGMVKGKMKLIFVEILQELKASGYRVSARLLNAMYFGVPQSRQRIIFIGVRADVEAEPSHPAAQTKPIPLCDALPSLKDRRNRFVHETSSGDYDFTRKPGPTLTVGHGNGHHYKVVEHPPPPLLNDKYGLMWSSVPIGGTSSDVIDGPRTPSRTGFTNCVKPSPLRPSPTLPKTQSGRGYATIVHPYEPRALSIEEAKIIGGFPDDFELVGTYSQQWARIGNSVPPPLMRAVAEHIRDHILRPKS